MTPDHIAQEAFTQHRRRVESVAARIVRDPEEAADIASEVFLALLERGPADAEAVVPWLVTSARNRALNRVRDKARAVRNLRRIDRVEQIDPTPADDRIPALVRETLARLGERDRLALTLRYGAEASGAAVAQRLGVTEAQARVVVHRAVQRMRAQAIAVLAERQGAPAACKAALTDAIAAKTSARHVGCGPCSALMDEVAALGAPALFAAPVVPLLERLASHVGSATHRMRAPRVHGIERAGELVAAFVLATSLGAGSLPATGASSVEPVAAASARVAGEPPGVASNLTARVGTGSEAGRVGDLLAIDDEEERAPIAPREVRLLGASLRVPDAVATGPSHASLDIRRFEVGTIADARGRAAGLLARVTLGAAPLGNGRIDIGWAFADDLDGCSGSLRGHELGSKPVAGLSSFCTETVVVGNEYTETEGVSVSVDGRVVSFRIDFAEMSREMASRLKPGARLDGIVVSTTGGEEIVNTGDNAPDGERADYTIQG